MKIKKNFVTLTSKKPTNEICRKENVVNADDKESVTEGTNPDGTPESHW